MPVKWVWSLLKPDVRTVCIGLCAIGALHILLIFAMRELTPTAAPQRLVNGTKLHEMVLLPALKPGLERLPFMSPSMRYAVCRFDTKDSDVSVRASLPEPGWVLALYTNEGDNFYVAVGQPGRKLNVALQLVANDDRFRGLTPQARGLAPVQDGVLKVPAKDGIVVLSAPDRGFAYREQMLSSIKLSSCQPTKS
jgi:uncharacterized membrane protein